MARPREIDPEGSKVIAVRVSPKLYDAIWELAAAHGITMASLIRQWAIIAMEQEGTDDAER